MRNRLLMALAACVLLTPSLHADCATDHDFRSDKNSGVLIADFTITGTQTLSSAEVAGMAIKLTGSCFDENSEEIEQRARALFQDRGYFGVEVKSARIKPSDQLAIPKPATLEAEVLEGPRYKLGEIKFVGNQAFSAAELRNAFPLKKGGLFARNGIAAGLNGVRNLYGAGGFLDWTAIPDVQILSNGTVALTVTIKEGPQYHMGELEILAKKELADKLQGEWDLAEGAIFDLAYISKYVSANRSLLPPEFTPSDVQVIRNCPAASVEVRLPLDATDIASLSRPKNVECEKSDDAAK